MIRTVARSAFSGALGVITACVVASFASRRREMNAAHVAQHAAEVSR